MNDKKKTNVVVQIDTEVWERLKGLAKLMKVDRNYLLESSVKFYLSYLDKQTNKMMKELEEINKGKS